MSNENSSLDDEVNKVLKYEIAQRHSYFQLKYFLIGKEPTIQSKMWQCLRELKNRKDSLDSLKLEVEETKDKIELLDIAIERIIIEKQNSFNVDSEIVKNLHLRESEIKIRQLERQKKSAETNLVQLAERKKWIEEESRFFLDSFKGLYKIEPLKHFDDLESQKQYWAEKLAQKLNLKMLTQNQLDIDLIETIIALPDDMPIKQKALGTLNLRHANMVRQLKETMQHHIEEKKGETVPLKGE